ncbi:MAG TPA: hypothetical protein VGK23_01045 [Methanomassiliicoccales archaeon]
MTDLPPIDDNLNAKVIKDQQIWLNELGHLSTKFKSPIMVQYSPDLRGRWMPIIGNQTQLIIARTILPNELVFDFDQKDWNVLKVEARKLISYLESEAVPYISGWSGGKGIHVHVFIDAGTLKINKVLLDKVQELEIDPLKIMRETVYDLIINDSGIDIKLAGLDPSAISWRSYPSGKGHMIREFGSLRDNGSRKTWIDDIPEERPTKDTIKFQMPWTGSIHQWDITELSELINGEIQRFIESAEKDDSQPLSIVSELDAIPCYYHLMQGMKEGLRNPGAYRIARFNLLMDVPQAKAQKDMVTYAHKCQGYDNELEKGCLETLKSAYKGEKSNHPGCGPIKETFGEEVCDWKKCPLKQDNPSFQDETPTDKSSTSKKGKKPIYSKQIFDAEPFQDPNNGLGFVIPSFKDNPIRSFIEWEKENKELAHQLESKFSSMCWPLPSRPNMREPDPKLLEDITEFIRKRVWFSDESAYSTLAAWVIFSWIFDQFEISPRVIIVGTTTVGKSCCGETLQMLTYRGAKLIDSTPAALFRLIQSYRITVFQDEYQKIPKERKLEMAAVFNGGYQKGYSVPRVNENGGVDLYDLYSPMLIGIRDKLPDDDNQNRSLIITMLQKPKEIELKERGDLDGSEDLRTRLLSLRLRVLSGKIDFDSYLQKVNKEISAPIELDGTTIKLEDRSKDNARSILTAALIAGGQNDIVSFIARSQGVSGAELKDSMSARVFYALQSEFNSQFKKVEKQSTIEKEPLTKDKMRAKAIVDISTRNVTDQLNTDLKQTGDNFNEEVKTRTVTNLLKGMGFVAEPGTGNLSFFKNVEQFELAYRSNLQKFGDRTKSSSEQGSK